MVRVHGNLYLLLVVTSVDNIVTTQKYSLVTWYYIEMIFHDSICAVHLETSGQFVASVFWVVCLVGIVIFTLFVTCSNMSFFSM